MRGIIIIPHTRTKHLTGNRSNRVLTEKCFLKGEKMELEMVLGFEGKEVALLRVLTFHCNDFCRWNPFSCLERKGDILNKWQPNVHGCVEGK